MFLKINYALSLYEIIVYNIKKYNIIIVYYNTKIVLLRFNTYICVYKFFFYDFFTNKNLHCIVYIISYNTY